MTVGRAYLWRGISVGLSILLCASLGHAACTQIKAEWIWGPTDAGNWEDVYYWHDNWKAAKDWDPAQDGPPNNTSARCFNVDISVVTPEATSAEIFKRWKAGPTVKASLGIGEKEAAYRVRDFLLGLGWTFKVTQNVTYTVGVGGDTGGRADINGYIWGNRGHFTAAGDTYLGAATRIRADGGARVVIAALPLKEYIPRNVQGEVLGDLPLLFCDGDGSEINLPALQILDDGFLAKDAPLVHTITAQKGGKIDLSGLTRIIGPGGQGTLKVTVDRSTIDLSSLTAITSAAGTSAAALPVTFNITNGGQVRLGDVSLDAAAAITLQGGSKLQAKGLHATKPLTLTLGGGSTLHVRHLRATQAVTLTLQGPQDRLEVDDDLDLSTQIAISNPGRAPLRLPGDFTYAHQDAARVPFRHSQVFVDGNSLPGTPTGAPQELEVGGLDVDTTIEALNNDNFGFGQMIVGRSEPNSIAFLVDQVDNGNRQPYAEALYLFGLANDPCGLRVENESVLYLGDLKVYARYRGVMTDLSELVRDRPLRKFDQGWLARGRPDVHECRNLVLNGDFEKADAPVGLAGSTLTLSSISTDLTPWEITNTVNWTRETDFADAGPGQWFVDLSSTPESKGIVSQEIRTPAVGSLYYVWFDVAPNPYCSKEGGRLRVSAAGAGETFRVDPAVLVGPRPTRGLPWPVQWQTKTWRFRAQSETTTLTFAAGEDTSTPFSVALDNVIVLSPGLDYPPRCFELLDHRATEATLTLVFSKAVAGPDDGIVIQGPLPSTAEVAVQVPEWKKDTLEVPLPPELPEGRYLVTLRTTIFNVWGEPLNRGVSDEVFDFSLDKTPPEVAVDALGLRSDSTPPVTGRVDDAHAQVLVTVADQTYPAQNRGDGTWTLADNTISPPLKDGDYEVKVAATDLRKRVGQGSGRLTIDSTPPRVTAMHLVTYDPMPSLAGTIDDRDKQATIVVTLINRDSPGTTSGPYEASNNHNGTWTLVTGMIRSQLDPGVYHLKVTATDRAGNVSEELFRDILEIPPT